MYTNTKRWVGHPKAQIFHQETVSEVHFAACQILFLSLTQMLM